MKTPWVNLLLVLVLISLAACAPSRPAQAQVAQSDKPRVQSPAVPPSDLAELVAGNSAFAFDLYQAIREKPGNLFYSPYSISVALAMTYAGARGTTERQMADVLRFTLPQDRLHPAFNLLDQALASRGAGAKSKDGKPFRLSVANSLWGQAGYKFLPAFLDTLAENYGAGLRLVDFHSAPEAARKTINDWVSDQTEGKIKDLIPQGAIDALTRLVLANAIYFNAAWMYPFDKDATQDGPFYLLDGSQVTVPMMRQDKHFRYFAGNGVQAVELPYDGGEVSMVILVPDKGKFPAFEQSLTADTVADILSKMETTNVNLTMPKFKYDATLSLAATLKAMGMPDAFSPDADFSGMDGTRNLAITDVFHKAFVAVDEAGTEAAAATAVVIGLTAMPVSPVELTVDRPFVFLIRDVQTGAILFVGRVLNPSA
ncbi:MAG: serpin family protein [Anaerolineae bacterium]|nr:serpin family protein [Anaerolineae bacterium]